MTRIWDIEKKKELKAPWSSSSSPNLTLVCRTHHILIAIMHERPKRHHVWMRRRDERWVVLFFLFEDSKMRRTYLSVKSGTIQAGKPPAETINSFFSLIYCFEYEITYSCRWLMNNQLLSSVCMCEFWMDWRKKEKIWFRDQWYRLTKPRFFLDIDVKRLRLSWQIHRFYPSSRPFGPFKIFERSCKLFWTMSPE